MRLDCGVIAGLTRNPSHGVLIIRLEIAGQARNDTIQTTTQF